MHRCRTLRHTNDKHVASMASGTEEPVEDEATGHEESAAVAEVSVVTEVAGFPGLTLLEAITAGHVEAPGLMDFNEFQKWRKEKKTRPLMDRDGVKRETSEEGDT